MEIGALRYLVGIADNGTLAQTARILGVTRQSVSKSLAASEVEAGARLFERQGSRLVPTERGQGLVRDAREVLSAFDALCERHLAHPGGASQGSADEKLGIALVVGGERAVPSGLFESFSSVSPSTTLELEEMSTDLVLQEVRSGSASLGIVGSHPDLLASMQAMCLWPMGVWLSVPSDSPLASHCSAGPADLDGVPLVTLGQHNHLHRFVLGRCARRGSRPRVLVATTAENMIARLARELGAVSFAFPPDVEPPREGRALLPFIDDGAEEFGTYLVRTTQEGRSQRRRRCERLFWECAEGLHATRGPL